MDLELKEEIDDFIEDWHWDEESYKLAFELCQYLFEFVDHLDKKEGLKEKELRRHKSNCWHIGILTCQYGYHEKFSPNIFAYPPYHEIEFKSKMVPSRYQLQSYYSTCDKVKEYVIQKGDWVDEEE